MEGAQSPKTHVPDDVMTLLREQAVLYGRLEAYSRRQRQLVSEDDVGPLLTLLAERQKLSQELTMIASRLAPARHEWSVFRKRLTPEQQKEADTLIEAAGVGLRKVIAEDEQDARVLSGRRQVVAGTLQSAHTTGAALSAYRVPWPRASRLDCKHGDA